MAELTKTFARAVLQAFSEGRASKERAEKLT